MIWLLLVAFSWAVLAAKVSEVRQETAANRYVFAANMPLDLVARER